MNWPVSFFVLFFACVFVALSAGDFAGEPVGEFIWEPVGELVCEPASDEAHSAPAGEPASELVGEPASGGPAVVSAALLHHLLRPFLKSLGLLIASFLTPCVKLFMNLCSPYSVACDKIEKLEATSDSSQGAGVD